jgi:hypothetical protein
VTWRGFGWQAAAGLVLGPLATVLAMWLLAAGLILGGWTDQLTFEETAILALPVFIGALLVGGAPALLAAVAMRAWEDARPTSPYRMAGVHAFATAAAFAAAGLAGRDLDATRHVAVALPLLEVPLGFLPVHLAVGAIVGTAAGLRTRSALVAALTVCAATYASLTVHGPRLLFREVVGGPAALALAVITAVAATFAAAWGYAKARPKTPAPAPTGGVAA